MRDEASWKQVERIHRRLIAACDAFDGDAIAAAVEARDQMLTQLRAALANPAEHTARLATLNQEATHALEAVQRRIRSDLLEVRQGVRAAQGYNGSGRRAAGRKSSALDRSG